MGILSAQLFFKWGFELQGAEPTPDQTAFGLSFPGLCAGGEFYLVHKPDKLRFRFEPLFPQHLQGAGMLLPLRILAKWTLQNVW